MFLLQPVTVLVTEAFLQEPFSHVAGRRPDEVEVGGPIGTTCVQLYGATANQHGWVLTGRPQPLHP